MKVALALLTAALCSTHAMPTSTWKKLCKSMKMRSCFDLPTYYPDGATFYQPDIKQEVTPTYDYDRLPDQSVNGNERPLGHPAHPFASDVPQNERGKIQTAPHPDSSLKDNFSKLALDDAASTLDRAGSYEDDELSLPNALMRVETTAAIERLPVVPNVFLDDPDDGSGIFPDKVDDISPPELQAMPSLTVRTSVPMTTASTVSPSQGSTASGTGIRRIVYVPHMEQDTLSSSITGGSPHSIPNSMASGSMSFRWTQRLWSNKPQHQTPRPPLTIEVSQRSMTPDVIMVSMETSNERWLQGLHLKVKCVQIRWPWRERWASYVQFAPVDGSWVYLSLADAVGVCGLSEVVQVDVLEPVTNKVLVHLVLNDIQLRSQ